MPDTRDRLLDVAEDVFYREGFHAVGLDRILAEVGVTKTTFYNHFQSKEDLILGVLRVRDQWWRKIFAERLRERAGDDPAAQLRAIFDVLDEFIAADAFNGCIFVNVAVEFPPAHEPAHRAAAEHKELMGALLRDLALRAGATDPIGLAEELALLMEGSYVTRQVTGNRAAAAIGRRAAALLIERQLGPPRDGDGPEPSGPPPTSSPGRRRWPVRQ
ncbi:MAG TPA: TetR/AcrR family transcriptional regulator [Candidatus Binatia bacterium]|nr:TetR/AcrR family transcriptional regulator [Candidatus Binatia bacterium]